VNKIGLFGGSFDPVHVGHLRVAEEVRGHLGLEKVFFIPAAVQPLKREITAIDADERLRMIRMSIRGNRFFRASDIEVKRGGISYSIDTVKSYARRFDDLYFLIGVDAFSEIDLWKDYGELFRYTNFAVMVRPNHKATNLLKVAPKTIRREVKRIDSSTYEHTSGKKLFLFEITQLDISSTNIRSLVQQGRSIRYLVADSVERFIRQRGLYKG
jgi:nicotinate-nucleotide adenylyltransferase